MTDEELVTGDLIPECVEKKCQVNVNNANYVPDIYLESFLLQPLVGENGHPFRAFELASDENNDCDSKRSTLSQQEILEMFE